MVGEDRFGNGSSRQAWQVKGHVSEKGQYLSFNAFASMGLTHEGSGSLKQFLASFVILFSLCGSGSCWLKRGRALQKEEGAGMQEGCSLLLFPLSP